MWLDFISEFEKPHDLANVASDSIHTRPHWKRAQAAILPPLRASPVYHGGPASVNRPLLQQDPQVYIIA